MRISDGFFSFACSIQHFLKRVLKIPICFLDFSVQISTFISAFAFFLSRQFKVSSFALSLLLTRFVRPEDIPIQYDGMSQPSDLQNGPPKPTSEFTVKGGEKVNIQIEGIEVYFQIFLKFS